ncbi:MAG: glutathione-dependent formaldehyde dehydrogenase [Acidobacteriota bacterium]|nr:glutathione-dependent formaldehyde dehydrogenase [Acidobacteriota bacterium]
MRAMTYRGPFRVRVEDKAEPQILHPEDAIVRVTRAAICGSDIHLYHGLMPDTRVGQTFGHEFIGIVEEVGPAVEKLKVGDKVLVPFNVCCGTCYFCSRGLYGNCHNVNPYATAVGGIYGYSHTAGGYEGGQAELVRVPFANFGPEVIPDGISDEDALMLTDACPTGYHAAQMGEINEGDTVLIFGAGPVGIFAARSAWLMGAGRVVVTDHLDYRLDFVSRYGPAEVINFVHLKDPVVYFKKITDFLGFDVVIDAVGCDASGSMLQTLTGLRTKLQAGNAVALHWAINSVRKAGTVVIIGAYGPPYNLVPLGSIVNKGLTVRANQASVKRQLPRLYEHVRAGRIKPSEIITHRFPLEDISEAYRVFTSKLDGCIKPVIIPPGAAA